MAAKSRFELSQSPDELDETDISRFRHKGKQPAKPDALRQWFLKSYTLSECILRTADDDESEDEFALMADISQELRDEDFAMGETQQPLDEDNVESVDVIEDSQSSGRRIHSDESLAESLRFLRKPRGAYGTVDVPDSQTDGLPERVASDKLSHPRKLLVIPDLQDSDTAFRGKSSEPEHESQSSQASTLAERSRAIISRLRRPVIRGSSEFEEDSIKPTTELEDLESLLASQDATTSAATLANYTTRASSFWNNEHSESPISDEPRLPRYVQRLKAMVEKGTIEHDIIRWSEQLYLGYEEFVKELLKEEEKMIGVLEDSTLAAMRDIAASTPRPILDAILAGTLPLVAESDPDIEAELKRISERARSCPSHYIHYCVDEETNLSPTPNQISHVLLCFKKYQREEAYSLKVDRIMDDSLRMETHDRPGNGYRMYFERACRRAGNNPEPPRSHPDHETEHDWTPSELRQKKVRIFRQALRKRISSVPADMMDKPLEVPLSEIGYANNVHRRLQEHRNHSGSNYVMNLFESICEVERDHLGGAKFIMKQFIIYNCMQGYEGALAEILFSRLGHGYIYNGGGFSHHPAGINNTSAWKSNKSRKTWEMHAVYGIQFSPWKKNLGDSLRRRDERYKREVQELQDEVDRLEAIRQSELDTMVAFYKLEIDHFLAQADKNQRENQREIAAWLRVGVRAKIEKTLDDWLQLYTLARQVFDFGGFDSLDDDQVVKKLWDVTDETEEEGEASQGGAAGQGAGQGGAVIHGGSEEIDAEADLYNY